MRHVCNKHGDLPRVLRATSRIRAKGRGCRTICCWLNARTATFFLSWSCLLGGDVVSCGLLSCCTGPEVYGADTWRLAGQWGVLVGNGPMGRTQIEIFRVDFWRGLGLHIIVIARVISVFFLHWIALCCIRFVIDVTEFYTISRRNRVACLTL